MIERLQALAERTGRSFHHVLRTHALEGVLRRLASAEVRDRYVLRGSLLAQSWIEAGARPAQDLDFLALHEHPETETLDWLVDVLRCDSRTCGPPDGVQYDSCGLAIEALWPDSDFPGIRATTSARIGDQLVPVQVDVGFGDPIDPPPRAISLPTLIGTARVLAVTPATAFAWKVHGLFEQATGGWQSKDLYDLVLLARSVELDRDELVNAIRLAFASRCTPLSAIDRFRSGSFGSTGGSGRSWSRLRNSLPELKIPSGIQEFVSELRSFVEPVLRELDAQGPLFPSSGPHAWRNTLPLPPRVESMEEVLNGLRNRDEISVQECEGVKRIDHDRGWSRVLPHPARAHDASGALAAALERECEGLVFAADGRLIARSATAVLELDQREEVFVRALPPAPLAAQVAHDGVLAFALEGGGEIRWWVRRRDSVHLGDLRRFIEGSTQQEQFEDFARDWIGRGATPLLRWCSSSASRLMAPETTGLLAIGARFLISGEFADPREVLESAKRRGLPTAETATNPWDGDEGPASAASLENTGEAGAAGLSSRWRVWVQRQRKRSDCTGVDLWFKDQVVRVTTVRGRELRSILESLHDEALVWRELLDENRDQLLHLLPQAEYPRALDFIRAFDRAIEHLAERMTAVANDARRELSSIDDPAAAKKEFGMRLLADRAPIERQIALGIFAGKDPVVMTRVALADALKRTPDPAALRTLLAGVVWPLASRDAESGINDPDDCRGPRASRPRWSRRGPA